MVCRGGHIRGCFSPLSCLGQKRSRRPPRPCRFQLESARAQEGATPPPPGQLASLLRPLGVGSKSRSFIPRGAQSSPSPPASPPGPWCSSREYTSPSSPVGRGKRDGVLGTGLGQLDSPLAQLHGTLQEGPPPARPHTTEVNVSMPGGAGGLCAHGVHCVV